MRPIHNALNMEHMEEDLRNYDVLHQKYFWDINVGAVPYKLVEMAVFLEEGQGSLREKWTPLRAQDAYLTARKVYGDGETIDRLGVLQTILEDFIGNFVGIEGIDRLFKASFFNFEWMMHLEYIPDRHDFTKYRDHYIHQIKNMYEMLVFLDKFGFMEYCIKAYRNKATDISNDIILSIRKQIRCVDEEEKDLFREILQYKYKRVPSDELLQERMQEHYYRYLFHAVAVISALTHDIGYPITFTLRMAKNLHEFLPLSDAFLRLNDAMPHLEEILQESLLYRTTGPKEIAERVKNKQDHGAVSAVMLLSQYYETGEIYHLSPIKRMAVELSAVVVYNHTLKYEYMTGKKADRYCNLFSENPISYLFRLCDDIQEWGRVYFDISKRSNFLTCTRCHMPITRVKESAVNGKYSCGCGETAARRTKVPYRKLTNILACDTLEITKRRAKGPKNSSMILTMEYNLVALLQLCLYSPQFAKQRADGIYEIKRMLEGQEELPGIYIDIFLSNNPIAVKVECLKRYLGVRNLGIQKKGYVFDAENFVTSLLVKKVDVGSGKTGFKIYKNAVNTLRYGFKIKNRIYNRISSIDVVVRKLQIANGVSGGSHAGGQGNKYLYIWERNLEFYAFMAFVGENIEKMRIDGVLSFIGDRGQVITFSKQLADMIADYYKIKDRPTRTLMMDFIWQSIRKVSFEEFVDANADAEAKAKLYLESSLSTEYMVNTVSEYVGSDAYGDVKNVLNDSSRTNKGSILEPLKGIYDFYTDYELFDAMARKRLCYSKHKKGIRW